MAFGYAESRQPFDEKNIVTHSMRWAMLRRVSMIGKSKMDKE